MDISVFALHTAGKKEDGSMSHYECMICGSHEHVLREGKLCLCSRCIEALGQALADKLESKEPQD